VWVPQGLAGLARVDAVKQDPVVTLLPPQALDDRRVLDSTRSTC